MSSSSDQRSLAPLPESGRFKLPVVVCPNCHYGFRDAGGAGTQYVCPRPECGYRWEAATGTIAAIHGHERRQAHPELHVRVGAGPRIFPLAEGETLIGRESVCQLRLESPNVSRTHARLVRKGDNVSVENLSGTTGTQVNGQGVTAATLLSPGDEVRVANIIFQFAVRYEAADSGSNIVDNQAILARGARAAPYMNGVPVTVIGIGQERITLGRSSDRTVVLNDPLISRRHAVLEPQADGCYLGDVQSRIGTYVNGKSIVRVKLAVGDRVQIGPYLFRFEGQALRHVHQPAGLAVRAAGLCQNAGRITLLDEITLALEPGEFVGLLGPSGAGKTTLLDALNGLRPAAAGDVFINDEPLYQQYDRLRHLIGYVPQEDIIHRELTCRQALYYAGRLRLPSDLSGGELHKVVAETLRALDLEERGDVPIYRLSGGQRKRVSVGVELLSQPGILFLDEPTSGLDPGTESRLMRKFRELADQGRTVVCTTHVMENVDLFHKVAVLAPGGRLAYFGPPVEAKTYFDIEKFTSLYDKLEEKKPEEWKEKFRRGGGSLRGKSGGLPDEGSRAGAKARSRLAPAKASSALGQWDILTRRFGRILGADRVNLGLLAAQPLLIAGLICLVFRDLPLIFFLLAVSALWFGCTNAAQQIVKERAIYRRERMVNLRLDAYILSKFLPLAVVCSAQCLLMLLMVWSFKEPTGNFLVQLAALALASWNGVALGLVISALATNADKAMSVVPLTLIPQIILAGVMVALPDMNEATRSVSYLVASRWANQALEGSLFQGRTVDADLLAKEGNLRPLWNLYPDYDLHSVEGQQQFLTENNETKVERRGVILTGLGVMGLFTLLQLAAVAGVLRRQDAF